MNVIFGSSSAILPVIIALAVDLKSVYNVVMKRQIKSILSEIRYHFVFCPRYRRKALIDDVERRFIEITHDICKENNWIIIEIDVTPDSCYLWLECLPTDRPTDIMARIKTVTSRVLRDEFKHLNHLESLWTRAFFISTADTIFKEEIAAFLDKQKTKG